MKTDAHRVHPALKVAVKTLTTIPFSSFAHAATATQTAAQAAAQANAAGTTYQGCPSGYFCIYPQDAGWNNDRPSLKYFDYGTYKLYNQYGKHQILNNQYSGAWVDLCTDGDGKHCVYRLGSGPGIIGLSYDLGSINSIVLGKP